MKPWQLNNDFFVSIKNQITSWEIFQPILFLYQEEELFHNQLEAYILSIFWELSGDKNYLYSLWWGEESIKIAQLREFFAQGDLKPSFWFQVFLIKNISKITHDGFHSMLKFLEEPGVGNIVFLTSQSEAGIPETVLSRLKIVPVLSTSLLEKNDFFSDLIDEFRRSKNLNIFVYFFQDKSIEKSEYIEFLETFLSYGKIHLVYLDLLSSVLESIQKILKNNVSPKYEVDILLLKLASYEK